MNCQHLSANCLMSLQPYLSRLCPDDLLLLLLILKQNFYCLYGRTGVWITELKIRTPELGGYDPYAFPIYYTSRIHSKTFINIHLIIVQCKDHY